MKYVVSEWSPVCAGEIVASVESIHEAVAVARACYQAQITAPAWGGGYVTTWAEGGASAKYFPGHDAWGFGGEIPKDAAAAVARLEDCDDLPNE